MLTPVRCMALLPVIGLIQIAYACDQTVQSDTPRKSTASDKMSRKTTDPAVTRLLQELHDNAACDPCAIAQAPARAGDPAAARVTLRKALRVANEVRSFLEVEKSRRRWETEMPPFRR